MLRESRGALLLNREKLEVFDMEQGVYLKYIILLFCVYRQSIDRGGAMGWGESFWVVVCI